MGRLGSLGLAGLILAYIQAARPPWFAVLGLGLCWLVWTWLWWEADDEDGDDDAGGLWQSVPTPP